MKNSIKFKSDEIAFIGDTHGISGADIAASKFPDGIDIVHIGDFGLGFGTEKSDACQLSFINEELKNRDQRMFVVRGNHDDPSYWEDGTMLSNLLLVKDYSTGYLPSGSKILFVGGGFSPDRVMRREGSNYWRGEVTPDPPLSLDDSFEYVFAHDCPTMINFHPRGVEVRFDRFLISDVHMVDEAVDQRATIDKVFEIVKPKKWIYGHYHNSERSTLNGCEFICLDISETRIFRL